MNIRRAPAAASGLAALLLILAPADRAAAQDLTRERLTEICRPQLEALDREEGIPFLQGEIDRGREYLAEVGRDADPESVSELRRFEARGRGAFLFGSPHVAVLTIRRLPAYPASPTH